MLIAVAGGPGTGTTTLCKRLAVRLGRRHVYAGQVFRALAAERGMTLPEFDVYAEAHPEIDRELDRRMVDEARAGDVVLDARLSLWHAREAGVPALRVLLVAPEAITAARVAAREGREDVEEVGRENRERAASEVKRYLALYGMDPGDTSLYDLVLDSSKHDPDALVERVVAALEAREAASLTN